MDNSLKGNALVVGVPTAAGIGDSIVKPLWRAKSRIKHLLDAVVRGHTITPLRVAGATSEALEEMYRVEEIVNDLLLLSGAIPIVKSRLDCKALIEGIVDGLAVQAWKHGITIDLQARGHFPPIRGDRHLLKRAITNLLLHAIDTNPKNSIVTVEAAYVRDPAAIGMRIIDQRQELSQADMEALFTPFNPAVRGNGLGLAVSKWVLNKHGGDVFVGNVGGGGTETRFLIPINLGQDAETESPIESGIG